MTSEAANAFDPKGALQQERDDLVSKLAELTTVGEQSSSYDQNFADSSQVTAEKGEAEALAASLSDALSDVDRALEKIANGTYGICEACGAQIDQARLEAIPTARFCMSCASKR